MHGGWTRWDARRAVGIAVVGTALVSALAATPFTLRDLERTHDRYASPDTRRHAAAARHGFDGDAWDTIRLRLLPRQRYAIVTARGRPEGFVDEGTVVRTFAAWRLLPAVQVTRPEAADTVLYVDVDAPSGSECVQGVHRLCIAAARQ